MSNDPFWASVLRVDIEHANLRQRFAGFPHVLDAILPWMLTWDEHVKANMRPLPSDRPSERDVWHGG